MKKKLTLAALLALVLGLWTLQGPSAQAACGQDGSAHDSAEETVDSGPHGPSNTYVYGAQQPNNPDGTPNGYVGVEGDTGYVELGGSEGTVAEGAAYNTAVDGHVSSDPSVCVASVTVPPAG